MMHRITCVVGARPNFIKVAAIIREFRGRDNWTCRLVHTGQHYSPEMSGSFFEDLEIPPPDVNLEVRGGSHTQQTASIMMAIEPDLINHRPDLLLVVGDVNSTMAASLVAAKLGIPIAHVEAGLRSGDRTMPEEINRIVTDGISDYLFVSEPSGQLNLEREGVPPEKIFFVGNVMIDTLLCFREKAAASTVLERLNCRPGHYVVATLHRPSNVDDDRRLEQLARMLTELSRDIPVVFPVHPRTEQRLAPVWLSGGQVRLTPPLGYLDFLCLTSQARLVLTDSGGIQEETTILGVPCLTVRENTERPATIDQGTNLLVGVDPVHVLREAKAALQRPPSSEVRRPDRWDGMASRRIRETLEELLAARAGVAPALL